MKESKIGLNKIYTTLILLVVFVSVVFVGNSFLRFNMGSTYSYLSDSDYTIGDIHVKGVQLKVYQNTGSGYTDVTDSGFDLVTNYFATDKTYDYDIVIRNDELAGVTADQYYLRWRFKALIDNIEYDITEYCEVDDAGVYQQEDAEGVHFYSVNSGSSSALAVQSQLKLLSSIKFEGEYDEGSDSYGSILDDEFSGSNMKVWVEIEGSLNPFTINKT